MSAGSSCGVFLNYRREDSGPYARLLKIRLTERFPDTPIFMDLDFIEAGVDFAEAIESALCSCVVMVTLIGGRWLTTAGRAKRPRLHDPNDLVRVEIQTALERGVRVIPVLVDGAAMPQPQNLPDDIAKLARLHALEMSYGQFEYDEARLVTIIEKVLAALCDRLQFVGECSITMAEVRDCAIFQPWGQFKVVYAMDDELLGYLSESAGLELTRSSVASSRLTVGIAVDRCSQGGVGVGASRRGFRR